MPTALPPGLRLGMLEPVDAIAAFEQRGLLQPSYRWQDVWQEEHSRGFAVAGVQRLDVLAIFADELKSAAAEGRSLADYRKSILPKLTAKGWWGDIEVKDPATGETRITRFDDRRLKLIYDVNMRQAFAAGRWARIERNKKSSPFVMYRTMRDELVRNSHRPWDGVVLPVDHPWWETHYPPNGWRCRCTAFGISQAGIDRRLADGEKLRFEAPPDQFITYVNPRSGEVVPVPRSIDPGFAYNPGRARDAALYDSALRKALAAAPLASAVAVAQATSEFPAFVASATARFTHFVDKAQAAPPTGETRLIGALMPGAVRSLQAQGIALNTAVVMVRDHELRAILDARTPDAFDPALLRQLPQLLSRTRAVLRDRRSTREVVYLVEVNGANSASGGQQGLAVTIELGADQVVTATVPNRIQSVRLSPIEAFSDQSRYQLLWGAL